MSYDDRLSDYNDVASRMREFFDKHPEGSLRPWNPDEPFRIIAIGDRTFIAYTAQAHRTPEDPNPGIGTAWEPFPGRTPYTKDSELMNAETSAWGRAILAVGAADTRKGIASREEVRNRQADHEDWEAASPASKDQAEVMLGFQQRIGNARTAEDLSDVGSRVKAAARDGQITHWQFERLFKDASRRLAAIKQAEAQEPPQAEQTPEGD